ncbi:MAG: response regulator [Colwellia sp.]|nr:response regulator [Colwellia sp.]
MMKILYVEDNEDNIYMLSRRLKRKGFEVLIAENGKLGVELCLKEIPDLILMDLSLPVMDGWQAIEIIKNEPTIKHIPIIALSAHAMDQHKQQALEAGADDFDSKPVDLTRLMSKINYFIGELK